MKFKIGFWNVNGLGKEKFEDEDFIKIVRKYDILCLSETWKEDGKVTPAPFGYKAKYHNRKQKHAKAKRNSGGILILYKTELHDHIKVVNNKDENIIWVKISKTFKGLNRDLLLGTVYISPKTSEVNKRDSATDTLEVLYQQVSNFNEEDTIILGGDFNARIGNSVGRVTEELEFPGDRETGTTLMDERENDLSVRERVSEDKKINAQGQDFNDFCTSTDLCVLNGRTIGDLGGKLTYIGQRGCSTVDFALASKKARSSKCLQGFKVENLNIFSDHCPTTVTLVKNSTLAEEKELDLENLEKRTMMPPFDDIYKSNMNTEEISKALSNLTEKIDNKLSEGSSIFEHIPEMESLMISTMGGERTGTRDKKHQRKKSGNQGRGKHIWFNQECRKLKNGLKHICKVLNKNPTDGSIRSQFYSTRKKYKDLISRKKREFERIRIEKMELSAHKGKDFWNDFKKIRNPSKEEILPSPRGVQTFFEDLYKGSEDDTGIPSTVVQNTSMANLSRRISVDEIEKHLKNLKRRKACGKDGILNEMLIFANGKLINIFRNIFNFIIDKEEYPERWNYSLTQLIYKDGDRDDPGNYRGIALTSNLSKLFNTIINTRLYTYLEENGIIRPEQGGFRKSFRTQDHIFTIQSLVDKYLAENKRIYACYVDLKKAYDSVWREGLFYKLRKNGIDEKTVNIITNMYKNTFTSIIYKGHLLEKIRVSKGLKQGDNLSPILFNIYINDLPEKLSEGSSDPVEINGSKINCLMWADDIILLSETPEGLQNCLNNLDIYCTQWKLEVNKKKTKIMIFNKSGQKLKSYKFIFNKSLLQNVSQYKYLGFVLAASGTCNHGINNLVDRSKRAWFSIYSILAKSRNKKVETYITLFEYVVKPILLYGCEVWGAFVKEERIFTEFGGKAWERFHLRVCKNILGVYKNTSNLAVLSEIGRYPISSDIHKQMVRYLLRFDGMTKSRLAKKCFEEQQLDPEGDHWLSKTKSFLDRLGLSFIHTVDNKKEWKSSEINRLSMVAKNRENEVFEQNLVNTLDLKSEKNEGKLLFFNQIKEKFGQEAYLLISNATYRNKITQLRLSAHRLEIEVGRHRKINGKKINRNDRICMHCRMGVVESEEHFLFECPNYTEEREMFMLQLIQYDEKYRGMAGGIDLLRSLFSSNDLTIFTLFGKFLTKFWEVRKSMCSNLPRKVNPSC